jgi:hypothetical protein
MFEGALAYMGLIFARLQFRNEVDHVQDMTEFFHGARNILITLPVGYEEAILAGNALRGMRDRADQRNFTIVHTGTRATSLADFQRCEVVRIGANDINRFSLPSRQLLQRTLQKEFDVAIDMNLDFVLHTAYICKASRAKVRVGFARPASDVFFNVQLNLHRTTPQALFEGYASCLAMF